MSWGDARDAIIAIPATVIPTVVGAGLAAVFRYDKTGHESQIGSMSRRYWGRVVSGRADGPTTNSITRHRISFEIIIEYVDQLGNTELIDEAIPTDAALLAAAFGLGSNWNRPTSGIVAVTPLSNSIAPWIVEQTEGARRLRITLEVRYQQ